MASFVVTLSATDLGQGLRTVIGQIAAETLGVPFEEVVIETADTDTGPHDMGTFASRATHRVGNAVIAAALEARQAYLDVAADELEVSADELETDGAGNLWVRGVPARSVRIADIAAIAQFKYGKTVSGRGAWMKPQAVRSTRRRARWTPTRPRRMPCTIAEVEVDTETGIVTVLSIRSAYEVGRQVNPDLVQGQIVGGAWMGRLARAVRDDRAVLPVARARPARLRRVPDARAAGAARDRVGRPRDAVVQRAVRGQGRGRDDRQLPDPGHRQRHLRRDRRAHRPLPVTPEKVLAGLDALAASSDPQHGAP